MSNISDKQHKAFSETVVSEETMRRKNKEIIAENDWLRERIKDYKKANTELTISLNSAVAEKTESEELLTLSLKGQFKDYLKRHSFNLK